MESTFVGSLLQQQVQGNFHKYGMNYHAIMCALYDVNKVHGNVVGYSFGKTKVKDLRERHAVFSWIINISDVICNHERRYAVAEEQLWEMIVKERTIGKSYVNAYEDQYANRCFNEITHIAKDSNVCNNANEPGGSLNDSTSLWCFLEQYYPSNDDEADSILSLPSVPCPNPTPSTTIPNSPNASYVSVEHPSSSASNDFPNPK
ncbi:hypothetical protein Salat_2141000 [Sesamum alatum]|uniref:Uncharacterized protein n=1 Tax=Sesamum alatum TaxID=300844 RepID=A0AAE1Y2H2_9LAMI|nr:hypothetical protein Salat_2141000 [Sesamum alatum]